MVAPSATMAVKFRPTSGAAESGISIRDFIGGNLNASFHAGRVRVVVGGLVAASLVIMLALALRPNHTSQPIPPLPPELPCRINLVLDTSASMQGYFHGRTDFKDTLSRLVSALDRIQPTKKCAVSITYQFATNSGELIPTNDNSSSFINKLLNGELMNGQDSLLQEMFRNIIAESSGRTGSDPSTLSILVTDSIFSYPDDKIRINPAINKENIAELASEVQLLFNDASKAGKAASVLAFNSQFHGTYFDYRNTKTVCCSAPRPYYMWLIGTPDNIRAIREFIEAESLNYSHAIDFGVQPFALQPTILQYTSRKGKWYRDRARPNAVQVAEPISASSELRFAIALDLSRLSNDQKTSDFLANHLIVQSTGLVIKHVDLRTRAEFEPSMNPRDKVKSFTFTHVLVITTDNKFTQQADLSIAIDNAIPSWYIQWSNEDDSKTNTDTPDTTFGLKYFVESIARSYHNDDPLARTTIHLER
jgi:hypothetical protein